MTRVLAALVLANAVMSLLGLSYGDYAISFPELFRVLTGASDATPQAAAIILDFRLPRVLLAMLVGLALAVAGTIAQALMRNALAEPGILGINSGAALAAVIVIIYLEGPSLHLLPWLSFCGALAMTVAIFLLSWRDGTSSIRIILVGIGLNAMAGGVATFISTLGEVTDMQQAMVWLSGSVYDSSWSKLQVTLLWLLPAVLLARLAARELDTCGFADDTARSLGQNVNLVRALLMLLCALISGAAVAAAGLISFVGLVAPHLARRLVGHAHGTLLPAAALTGSLLVVSADLLGRTVIAPTQLPVGLMTAILGAPVFFYLLWKRRHG